MSAEEYGQLVRSGEAARRPQRMGASAWLMVLGWIAFAAVGMSVYLKISPGPVQSSELSHEQAAQLFGAAKVQMKAELRVRDAREFIGMARTVGQVELRKMSYNEALEAQKVANEEYASLEKELMKHFSITPVILWKMDAQAMDREIGLGVRNDWSMTKEEKAAVQSHRRAVFADHLSMTFDELLERYK